MAVGKRNSLAFCIQAEGGGDVVPALQAVFGGLGVGELGPLEEVAKDGWVAGSGGFQAVGYSAGYYFRLVESSFEFFAPVKGDWDYVIE